MPYRLYLRRYLLLAAALLLASCVATRPVTDSEPETAACRAWLMQLDERIDRAGVRDAEGYRIPGFAYLRANRFLASLAPLAARDDAAFDYWQAQLTALDRQARQHELRNLPGAALPPLARDAADAMQQVEACRARLAAADFATLDQRNTLIAQAQVPDDYATGQRVVGLYGLLALPFYAGVTHAQAELQAAFAKPFEATSINRYQPAPAPLNGAAIHALWMRTPRDRLGIPQFSPADADALLAAYAPLIEVEALGDFDRIGAVQWGQGKPTVNVDKPAVYQRVAFTRLGGKVLPQLVYTVWFSARPKQGAVDLLAGSLDGLIWRVTLDDAGQPLIYDSIHPCGCYHQFFPTARMTALPAPHRLLEWAFVPQQAPLLQEGERVLLRLQSATHYLQGVVAAATAAGKATPYELLA
ncbi:MAG: hypothetical protein JNM52_04685, partial [Betaproteobacteria bacterium]|nr:hypothetical protein [Betaproteobacteria bacterium]